MTPRLASYRAVALLLAATGTATCWAAGIVPWGTGVIACIALVAASRVRSSWAAGPVAVVALLSLTQVGSIDQHDRPPAAVADLLLLAVALVGVRARSAADVDAAVVAGLGLGIVGGSTAVGRGAVLPLVGLAGLLVGALWFRPRAHRSHEAARPASTGSLARVVGAGVGVATLALLAAPVPSSTGLHDSLFHRHGAGATGGTSDLVSPDAFGSTTLDLGVRGTLSTAPVATVTADAPVLWRGAIYRSYDGAAWHTAGSPALQGHPSGPRETALVSADPQPVGPPVRLTVDPVPGTRSIPVYAPGDVVSVTTAGRVQLGTAGSAAVVGAAPSYAETVVLPPSTDDPVGADPSGWTALPDSLPQRVRDLARTITADVASRPAQAAAVEGYLRVHERYTLTAPVPAAGSDAVDDFLFRSHEGFCEQFASAETVLLRAIGVPARLVTGFGYGRVDGGGRVFTQADAHAWVEVSAGARGWVPSDPTAGSQLLPARQSLVVRSQAFVRSLEHSAGRRAALVGLVVLLVLVGVGIARVARRRSRRVVRGPVGTAFARLERRWPRPPSATPREYAASLPGDLEEALAAWEAELFAAGPSADPRAAVAQVDALRRTRTRG